MEKKRGRCDQCEYFGYKSSTQHDQVEVILVNNRNNKECTTCFHKRISCILKRKCPLCQVIKLCDYQLKGKKDEICQHCFYSEKKK